MKSLAITFALALLWTGAAFAQAGNYNVRGDGPGGAYTGTVTVEANGQTWKVRWRIGATTYEGVGVLHNNVLSIGYESRSVTGVQVMRPVQRGGGWEGVWATVRTGQPGTEVWAPAR